MPHGQNGDSSAVIAVKHDISAVSELDEPFEKLGRHVVDRSTAFRVSAEPLDALANRADRTSRGLAVLRREERVKTRNISQCRRRSDERGHWAGVRNRRLRVLTGFQSGEPQVGLVRRDVLSRRFILSPSGKCVVA